VGIYEKVGKEIKNAKSVMERKQEIIFCVVTDGTHTVCIIVYSGRPRNVQEEIGRCGGCVDIAIICEMRCQYLFCIREHNFTTLILCGW
jgi:hypothetical protein